MKRMPAVGTWVRLIKGRSKRAAKVVGHLWDIEGGLQLSEPLDGFRYWNVADVRPDSPSAGLRE